MATARCALTATTIALFVVAGCGGAVNDVASTPPSSPASVATPTTREGNSQGVVRRLIPEASSTTTTSTEATMATDDDPVDASDFAVKAATAYGDHFGDFRALEVIIWVGGLNRAEAEVQDPEKPANVDTFEYKAGQVGKGEPVKLTGNDADLDTSLFSSTEVAWDTLPTMMADAVTAMGALEGSSGVTHLIVKRNVPFDNDVVVNVYVDGGARTSGGYVQFLGNGTLKRVFGPS